MNTTQRNLIGLMALALLISMTPVQQASAKTRLRATVNTPHLSVRVSNHQAPVYRYKHLKQRSVRRHFVVRINKQDRKMAKRLARYTGSSKGELVRLRKSGYTWREIGRYLDLRPRVVRAARHADTWEDFLYGGCHVVRCGTHRHR